MKNASESDSEELDCISETEVESVSNVKWQRFCLWKVEQFVESVLGSADLAFKESRGRLVRSSKLADYFDMFFSTLDLYDPRKKYNANVKLYFDSLLHIWNFKPCRLSANDEIPDTGVLAGCMFNRLITAIRHGGERVQFRVAARALRKAVQRREKEYFSYADDLFERFSRLMVVRVDLHYLKIESEGFDTNAVVVAGASRLNSDLQRMLSNARHKPALFEHLVGYILKLESGDGRGAHVHCLLFFNGAYVCKDVWYAEEIGKYWRDTITHGDGTYWNCNSRKAKYKRLAVGMVNHFDHDLRSNLKGVITYLCKIDQLIERDYGSKMKGMRRGVSPSTWATLTSGRPRKSASVVKG